MLKFKKYIFLILNKKRYFKKFKKIVLNLIIYYKKIYKFNSYNIKIATKF